MENKENICVGCKEQSEGHLNNGNPLFDGRVCDTCNMLVANERMQGDQEERNGKRTIERITAFTVSVLEDATASLILNDDGDELAEAKLALKAANRFIKSMITIVDQEIDDLTNS